MNSRCEKMRDEIVDYVLGILNQDEIEALDEHINQCSQCKEYADTLKTEKSLLLRFGKKLDKEMNGREAKVIEALDTLSNEKTRLPSIWRIIMKSRMTKFAAAAVIIIAVLIGINQFRVPIDGASVTWASVVEKLDMNIRASNTIHILLTICSISPKISKIAEDIEAEPVYVKGEQWFRRNPMAAKTIIESDQTVYFFQDTVIGLNHGSKTWFKQPITKEQERRKLYGFFDALVSGDFKTHLTMEGFTISDGKAIGQEMIEHENTTVYEFSGKPIETTEDATERALVFRCWISNSTNRVLRLHQYFSDQDEPFISCDLIEYNVDIPAGTLDAKIPEGYTRWLSLEEKIRATVPKDIVELKQAYDSARKTFPNYKMIVLGSNRNVKSRVAREGEKWRVDTYRQGIKDTGIFNTSRPLCFSDLWNRIGALQGCIERTVMSYNGGSARVFWPQEEDVEGLPKTLYQKHVGFSDVSDTLEYLTWPRLPLIGPNSDIELLPPSEKYPGCIGIRYSQRTGSNKLYGHPQMSVLVIYWIDPSKDYICIRHERHQRPNCLWKEDDDWFENEATTQERAMNRTLHYSSEIADITQSAQTPEGYWYPKEIRVQKHYLNNNGTRIVPSPELEIKRLFIDTQIMAKPEFLQWPEQLPLPEVKLE